MSPDETGRPGDNYLHALRTQYSEGVTNVLLRVTLALPLILAVAPTCHAKGLPLLGDGFVPVCDVTAAGHSQRFLFAADGFEATFSGHGQLEYRAGGTRVQIRFAGASPASIPTGRKPLAARINTIAPDIPPDCQSRTIFAGVEYRNLYPGIDARYYASRGSLESEFYLAPGVQPGALRFRYSGVTSLRVSPGGELEVRTPSGIWREKRPVAWQESSTSTRESVPVQWQVHPDGTAGFTVGSHDPARPVIIDPVVTYSTYLANASGSTFAAATGTTVDASGNVYVSGWVEGNALGSTGSTGSVDAFLMKLDPAGHFLFATYFGGSGDDRALAVTIDSSQQPWITGYTYSSNLPVRNAFQSTPGGYKNAFVAQFSSSGTLQFASYLGGSGPDSGNAIGADPAGNVYIAGDTQSPNLVTRSAMQSGLRGAQNLFAAKVGPSGALMFCTYLGGSGTDHASAIAVDATGNSVIVGGTTSADFPTRNPYQAALRGTSDAIVAKIDTYGGTLYYATYLGGTGGSIFSPEQANAVALDSQGNICVAGYTPSADFPTTSGALQTAFHGQSDGFAVKLNPSAGTSGFIYGTYLGGAGQTVVTGMVVDTFGAMALTGYTSATDFLTLAAAQGTHGGLYDAFLTILNPAGSALYYSSFLGGSGVDAGNSLAADNAGNLYLTGQTGSLDYPVVSGLGRSHTGGIDAFLVKLQTADTGMFAYRMYFGVLGMATPSASSVASWTGTAGQVANAFFGMPQVQSGDWYVEAAYRSVLGRDPDYGGYVYWTGKNASGVLVAPGCVDPNTVNLPNCAQQGLLAQFIASPEFQNRFNASSKQAFVTTLYRNVLLRDPDPGGLSYWVPLLDIVYTRQQMLHTFIVSPEFKNNFGNRNQVMMAFFHFLLRPPSDSELAAWTASLSANGGDTSGMIATLVTSAEFKAGL